MLDLELFKASRFKKSGMVDIGIHVKPSSQGKNLCSTSWHMPSVHRSWPNSRLIHFQRCVSDDVQFRSATLALVQKLRISSPGHPSLATLATAYVTGSFSGNGKQRCSDRKASRLILPYHPCFAKLGRRLSIVVADFLREGFPDLAPSIVFSNGGLNLARRVQSSGLSKMMSYVRGSGRIN